MSSFMARRSLRLLRSGMMYSSSSTLLRGIEPCVLNRLAYHPRSVSLMGTWTDRLKGRWQSNNQGEKNDQDDKKEQDERPKEESEGENLTTESSEVEKMLADKDAQIQANEEKIKELEEKFLRALAETENTRTRLTRQVEEAKKYGIQDFSKGIVEVADLLDTAIASVQKDDLHDNKPLLTLYEGLKLTTAEMLKVMSKNGLEKITEEGVEFDPNIHEALFEVPGDKAGTIAVVSRVGYTLHGRTIRPARVGVVKSPES